MSARKSCSSIRLVGHALAMACFLGLAPSPGHCRDGEAAGLTVSCRTGEGMPRRIAWAGDVGLLGLDSGLGIVEVSPDAPPVRLAHLFLPGPVLGVSSGRAVVTACGEAGVMVIDASDPGAPCLLAQVGTPGVATSVVVRDDVAFVTVRLESGEACGELRVFNIADPVAPLLVGRITLPGAPRCVTSAGDLVLVGMGACSCGASGLALVDVGTVALPHLVAVHPTARPVNAISVRDSVAFLATGLPMTGTIESVDVADPASPRALGVLSLADSAEDVTLLADETLLVAAAELGVLEVDAHELTQLRCVGRLATGRSVVAVASHAGGTLIGERTSSAAGGVSTLRVDADGTMEPLAAEPMAEVMDVAQVGDEAFVLRRDAFCAADVSNPRLPSWLWSWRPDHADFSALALGSDVAALGQGAEVRLLHLEGAAAPVELARHALEVGVVVDMSFSEHVLVVATGRGLELLDTTSGHELDHVASFQPRTWADAVDCEGETCLVAGCAGVEIVDVANAAAPQSEGWLDVGTRVYSVALHGDVAFVVGEDADLVALDISDPARPRELARVGSGPAYGLSVEDGRVAVAAGGRGVWLFDIARPSQPRLVGSFDTSGEARCVALHAGTIQVAAESAQHWMLQEAAPPQASLPVSGANSAGRTRLPARQPMVRGQRSRSPVH